jgi:hypothetical protein
MMFQTITIVFCVALLALTLSIKPVKRSAK